MSPATRKALDEFAQDIARPAAMVQNQAGVEPPATAPPPEIEESAGYWASTKRGMATAAYGVSEALSLVGDVLGVEAIEERGEAGAQYWKKVLERPELQRPEFMRHGLVEGLKRRPLDYSINLLLENIPLLVTMMSGGGVAGVVAARALPAAVKAGIKAGNPAAISRARKTIGRAAMGGAAPTAGAIEGGFARGEALEAGATDEQALEVALRVGVINAALEVTPIGLLFRNPAGRRLITRIGQQIVAEAGTEAVQEFNNNLQHMLVHQPDKTLEDLFEGTPEAAYAGGLIGALMGAGGAWYNRGAPEEEGGAASVRGATGDGGYYTREIDAGDPDAPTELAGGTSATQEGPDTDRPTDLAGNPEAPPEPSGGPPQGPSGPTGGPPQGVAPGEPPPDFDLQPPGPQPVPGAVGAPQPPPPGPPAAPAAPTESVEPIPAPPTTPEQFQPTHTTPEGTEIMAGEGGYYTREIDAESGERRPVLKFHEGTTVTTREGRQVPIAEMEVTPAEERRRLEAAGQGKLPIPEPRETIDEAEGDAAASPENQRPEPTPAQKEAGNYPKGHVKLHGRDLSIETPRDSHRWQLATERLKMMAEQEHKDDNVSRFIRKALRLLEKNETVPEGFDVLRRMVGLSDKPGDWATEVRDELRGILDRGWIQKMSHTYGYIRGTTGFDKDHLDVFLHPDVESRPDAPVFVVNQQDEAGEFDEHKVMMGFTSEAEARKAYLENYPKGWEGLDSVVQLTPEQFDQWARSDAPKKGKLEGPPETAVPKPGKGEKPPPSPERPFTPTHELPDGTPVRHVEDDVYVDAQGQEWEEPNAAPIETEPDDDREDLAKEEPPEESPEDEGTPTEPDDDREDVASESERLAGEFQHFFAGADNSFKDIREARKWAGERLGRKVAPGTADAKLVDESMEAGLVRAAREIVRSGRKNNRTWDVIFDRLVNLYERQPRLGVRTSTSVSQQAYSTPMPIAWAVSVIADVGENTTVYEPSAGNGALLIGADPGNVHANELNEDRSETLEAQGFGKVTRFDAATENPGKQHDVVLANPPFGVVHNPDGSAKKFPIQTHKGEKRTTQIDHAIAMRSLASMKKGGTAVLILGSVRKTAASEQARSDAYHSAQKRDFFWALYHQYEVVDHFTIAGELYEKQGAGWPIDIVVVKGRKDAPEQTRTLPAKNLPDILRSFAELKERVRGHEAGLYRPESEGVGAGEQSGGPRGSTEAEGRPESQPGAVPGPVARPGGVAGAGTGGGRTGGGGRSSGTAAGPASKGEQPPGVRGGREGRPEPPDVVDRPRGARGEGELEGEAEPGGLEGAEGSKPGAVGGEPAGAGDLGRELESASEEDIDSLIDDALGEAAPEPAEARPEQKKESLKGAASESGKAISSALDAIWESTGGGSPATFKSGPFAFDEQGYQRIKGHLKASLEHTVAAGGHLKDFIQAVFADAARFPREWVENLLRPAVKRFVNEVNKGLILIKGLNDHKKRVQQQDKPTEHQVSYEPGSDGTPGGTLIPKNMRTAVKESLGDVKKRRGPLSEYVMARLGYTREQLDEYFLAEQIDALALAIDNMERGGAFIIGDQTGVGKGRVVAGALRYAMRQGKVPVFVTEKKNLYKDIYRDFVDIGMGDVTLLMTDASEKVFLTDDKSISLRTPDAQSHNANLIRIARGVQGLDQAFENVPADVIVTTYYQMQSEKGALTPRREFLNAIAPNAMFVFDETHNAGGTETVKRDADGAPIMDRARYVRHLAATAWQVFFSSATYAKRHDVMDLYARTDMRYAVSSIEGLGNAIKKGGVPLQQVVALMLAKAGQYLRRERSFDGIEYSTPLVEVNQTAYANFSRTIEAIHEFSKQVEVVTSHIDDELKGQGMHAGADQSTGGAGAESTKFTSIMHNLISQLLLSLKAQPSVDMALEAIANGQKPVITVSNTMGSFLDEYAEAMELNKGDLVALNFTDLLKRYLDKTRTITKREPFGEAERHYLTDEELGPQGVALYNRIADFMASQDEMKSLPVSPIDYIIDKIEQAGHTIGEITGREKRVRMERYEDQDGKTVERPVLDRRPDSISLRIETILRYNQGGENGLDALIINRAGSTGISLHASESVGDQRQRTMIIAQPEDNIDTHMQVLGRINRTGQVVKPRYLQLVADIPAEKRPAAVLSKKMASLNANTTAARSSSLTATDVPDFINEYGDEVVGQILDDDMELFYRLDVNAKLREGTIAREDLARKTTGRIPLLPIEDQEALYDRIESDYKELIAQLDATGANTLEAKYLPLDAEELNRKQLKEPLSNVDSPFAEGADAVRYRINVLGRPYPTSKVLRDLSERLGRGYSESESPEEAATALRQLGREGRRKILQDAKVEFESYKREVVDQIKDEGKARKEEAKLDQQWERFAATIKHIFPGNQVQLDAHSGRTLGTIMDVVPTGETKNPIAGGGWKVTIYLVSSARQITLPLSRLKLFGTVAGQSMQEKIQGIGATSFIVGTAPELQTPIILRYDEMQEQRREERWIVTGNLLAGFDAAGAKGQIITFETREGTVVSGIMMPKEWDVDAAIGGQPVRFSEASQVVAYVARVRKYPAFAADNIVRIMDDKGQGIRILVEPSRSTGGKYYMNEGVLEALGEDFVSSGSSMVARVSYDGAQNVVQALMDAGAEFEARTEKDIARQIAGLPPVQEARRSAPAAATGRSTTVRQAREAIADQVGEKALRHLEQLGVITLVQSRGELPEHLQKDAGAGVYDFENHRAYLVADEMGKEDAYGLFLHEVGVHYGLEGLLGEDLFDRVLRQLRGLEASGNNAARRAREQARKKRSDASEDEETLAYVVQDPANHKLSLVRRVVSGIRAFLFRIGVVKRLSIDDIVMLVRAAARRPRPQTERRARKGARAHSVRMPTDEQERRYQEAKKGLGDQRSLVQRVRDHITHTWHGISRHFIELPNTPFFAPAFEILREFEAAPEAAKEEAVRRLQRVVGKFNDKDLDLFTRKVLLDDLQWEIDNEHELPFALSPEDHAAAKADVDAAVADNPDVQEAVRTRSRFLADLRDRLVEAGVLSEERANNPHYFRHQVLLYARLNQRGQSARKVKKPRPGYAMKREGSLHDINAHYIEAEFDFIHRALIDLKAVSTIAKIDDRYNIQGDLKNKARMANTAAMEGIIAQDIEENGWELENGNRTSPLDQQWKGYKQRIARGTQSLGKMLLADGAPEVPSQYQAAVEELIDSAREHQEQAAEGVPLEERTQIGAISDEAQAQLFPLLRWLLQNDATGAAPAGMILKAVSERREFLKESLGKNYKTWRSLVPDGYVTWQPEKGNIFYTAKTFGEDVMNRLLGMAEEYAPASVDKSAIRDVVGRMKDAVVLGQKKKELVIPEELAATLEHMAPDPHDGLFDHLFGDPLRWWRQWVLINPRRVLKYNLNNLSGDLDAVIAGAPSVLKKLPRAIRELYDVMHDRAEPSELFREAVDRGVFDSGLTIQEIPDINYLSKFRNLVKKSTLREPGRFTVSNIARVWHGLRDYTRFRENWMRYAAFLHYVEKLDSGVPLENIGFGGSNPDAVKAIYESEGPHAVAGLLARELVGDYGAVSHYGQEIRQKLIHFYSWMEINTKRYTRFFRNAWEQGFGSTARVTGVLAASVARKGALLTAGLYVRMFLLFMILNAWNHLMFGDEEEELNDHDRVRLHIILGRSDDGTIRLIRFQGALSDFLDWFGWQEAVAVMSAVEKGRGTATDLLETVAQAPINKIFMGLTPVIKTPLELMSGLSFFPDVFNPRPIRDRGRHVARLFSAEHEYDVFTGRPSRGYAQSLEETVIVRRDAGEIAYNKIKGLEYDWAEKQRGTSGFSTIQTARSQATYRWKIATRYGDKDAAKRAMADLKAMGVTKKDINRIVKRGRPLGVIAARDRGRFLQSLTARERETLEAAKLWYKDTFR